ncbi:hypothetical protein A3C96_00235 [Candidatus Uhrbacteria bacterium RIFCSPHIGHO2_02_FULL_60_10]|uniref:2-oxoglutarate dehydrogenase n=1 Tax=Candidatus Uhrbacteria bacterium RIFCSPHIGHO2_02_FULL_60_10 TaxID=1802392 RepID=A0A1F7U5T7_9BACT|nr:MAG: hypothetical protein A3C96_00235 [Candidatus Uhrbacteria bacterium RIFCSPHIGHO2_02_FULL_60_10]
MYHPNVWRTTRPLWIAWGLAVVGTLGSLYFSEWMGFAPCPLCWFQRLGLYPLVVILGLGLWRRDRDVWLYAAPFSLFGLAFAIYHNLLYYGALAGTCSFGSDCTTRQIDWFGFISIPLMSLAAFVVINVMLWLERERHR